MSDSIKLARDNKQDFVLVKELGVDKTLNRALLEINVKQCSLVVAAVIQLSLQQVSVTEHNRKDELAVLKLFQPFPGL